MSDAYKDAVMRDMDRERDAMQYLIQTKDAAIDRLTKRVEQLERDLLALRSLVNDES